MLLSYPLASSSGFDSYYRNSGEMRNRGIEFAVTGRIFDRRDFQWSVTWMGSTVSNKVLKLTEDGKDIIGSTQIIREGETLYSYYVARSAGVDPMTRREDVLGDGQGRQRLHHQIDVPVAQANRVIARKPHSRSLRVALHVAALEEPRFLDLDELFDRRQELRRRVLRIHELLLHGTGQTQGHAACMGGSRAM